MIERLNDWLLDQQDWLVPAAFVISVVSFTVATVLAVWGR